MITIGERVHSIAASALHRAMMYCEDHAISLIELHYFALEAALTMRFGRSASEPNGL